MRLPTVLTLVLSSLLLVAQGAPAQARTEKAIVAGGCFWCVESDVESMSGVISAVSGYTGGNKANPTYEDHEGHYEAVEIVFDPDRISYAELMARFLRSIDVTDSGGQFCDRGSAYRTAIFALNAEQKATAQAAVAEAGASLGRDIVTPVLSGGTFWKAEDYHQDYERNHPNQSYVRMVSIPRLNAFKAKMPEVLK